MKTIEMIVSLKVPDTTAITALQTLQKLGFKSIKDLKRENYYNFSVDGDAAKFKDNIKNVDIIVNANKHLCDFSVKKDGSIKILVKNINNDGTALLSTLKNRLGFKNIKKIESGVLWSISSDAKTAEKAAKELLVNEHYQEYRVI